MLLCEPPTTPPPCSLRAEDEAGSASDDPQAGGAQLVGGDSSSGGDPIAAAVAAAAQPADDKVQEAALKRATKAAALPLPEHRSSSEGMVLSPGAAAAAASCRGERCELLACFVLAAAEAARLADVGGLPAQQCPAALGVGLRPLPYNTHAFGNRCEPLFNRGALEVVRQLLQPDWHGLEWLTGGSTAWLLQRIAHLTSVEGARGGWCTAGQAEGGTLGSRAWDRRAGAHQAAACLRCPQPPRQRVCAPAPPLWLAPLSPPCRVCGQGAGGGRGSV